MIQIGRRESHDIDIFVEDLQLLGSINSSRSQFHFGIMPSACLSDGLRTVPEIICKKVHHRGFRGQTA